MQLAALRHRTESEDCTVIDHSHVKIRLHTAKDDVEKVIVHYTDNYLPPNKLKNLKWRK
jgi:neopullulanase